MADSSHPIINGLNFRNGDNEPLVKDVLLGNKNAPAELLSAALLIVYRYRNNLFHGIKWTYGLEGQQSNFENAIDLLINVMEMRTESRLQARR